MHAEPLPSSLDPRRAGDHFRRLLPVALLVGVAAGCAGPKAAGPQIVWPFPPDRPRIKHVRSFSGTADFETSGLRKAWRTIAGGRGLAIENPTAIALTADERKLYVTAAPVGLVVAFDLEKGTVKRAANVQGLTPKVPFGVVVDGNGNLYVADQGERLVWVYSADGKFVRQIGKGTFDRPTGLAFDRRRQLLYVVDGGTGSTDRHRVEVFAPDGRPIRTMGKRGEGPGEFNFPSYAAVAPDGRLYVADTGNFRIQVFDPDGALMTSFGAVGDGPGLFGKVKGISFDTFGNVYVVDGQVGVVQMFNPSHRSLMYFGGAINRPEFMYLPNGIAIDSKNNIYVADYGFNHVNQYALINTSQADSREIGATPTATPSQPKPASPPSAPDASN